MGYLKILLKSYELFQHYETISHFEFFFLRWGNTVLPPLITSRQSSLLYKQKSIGTRGCGHAGAPRREAEPRESAGDNADGHVGLMMENRLRAGYHYQCFGFHIKVAESNS